MHGRCGNTVTVMEQPASGRGEPDRSDRLWMLAALALALGALMGAAFVVSNRGEETVEPSPQRQVPDTPTPQPAAPSSEAAAAAASPEASTDGLPADGESEAGAGHSAEREASPIAGVVPALRTVDVYRGYGAWVDVFDYSPPYAGDDPPVTAAALDQMAADGVETVFLQAARHSSRSPGGIEDRELLAQWLIGAHERGMAVVAWYLPRWTFDGRDLNRIKLLDEFQASGHRFDGVAVDIEWTDDGLTPTERSERLVAFSRLVSDSVDGPLGAIVLPPVLIEVVNRNYWPAFPWRELAPLYDVWLPMSYWSFRSGTYGDGYSYHEESVRRLRANLSDEDALVHGIGGIGGTDGGSAETVSGEPLATLSELRAFVRALDDSGSIGGSIYDWNTLSPVARAELATMFAVRS